MELLLKNNLKVISTVDNWMLMSPAPMLLIFGTYLFIVLNLGPRYMKERKPFPLTNFTRIYNIAQLVACSVLLTMGSKFGLEIKSMFKCLPDETDSEKLIAYKSSQWWFLILRLAELMETIVFVLRKKQNQVSLLHIYHHISTASLVWIFIKYTNSKLIIKFLDKLII